MRYSTAATATSPANARPRIICGSGRSRAGQGSSVSTEIGWAVIAGPRAGPSDG